MFPAEALEGLDAVADQMKNQGQTKAFVVEGFVTRLDRPAGETESPGDIVMVPTGDDELRRVSVHLDAASYADAIRAHSTGDTARVVGTLRKQGRRWLLSDASGFELVPAPVDDDEFVPAPPSTSLP